MSLRAKLMRLTYDENNPDQAVDLLHTTNPTTASISDLVFLLRLRKPRINNRLAYLQIEADIWLRDNWKALKKRNEDSMEIISTP